MEYDEIDFNYSESDSDYNLDSIELLTEEEEEGTDEIVSGDVRENEFLEQLEDSESFPIEVNIDTESIITQFAIVEDNQQQIINNLSYQSNLFTLGFFVFVGVLIMKCFLHFFN